jgi:hypothetical protein
LSPLLVSIFAGIICLGTTGCVTPFVATSEHCIAIGIYNLAVSRPNASTTCTSLRGLGLAFQDGKASIGLQNWNFVRARLEGSYIVRTPQVTLAVGKAAEGPAGWALVLPAFRPKEW